MPLFRRKSAPVAAAPTVANPTSGAAVSAATAPSAATESTPATGPYDLADQPELGPRVDLGSLRVPVISGMQVRMELDRATQQITGVTVMLQQPQGVSSLQLQAFAAPRSAGIWDEIRKEIADGITKSGSVVDDVPGELGRELVAHITRQGPNGAEVRQARFIGQDGPRWFLRGVITGPAATDPEAAKQLEDIFRETVVVRDNSPKPPRDLLPLSLPGSAQKIDGPPAEAKPTLAMPQRGPEITEVH